MTAFREFSARSPLVLVGAGKMGGALLKGWLDRGLEAEAVIAIDPAPPPESRAFLATAGITIDAGAGVPGPGPAYVFLLTECLAAAAVAAGLPRDIAERLARETVTGSAELLHRSDRTPAELRENVTSPNGTTAAALAVLMAPDGLAKLMARAVAAAKRRSEELAG